MATPIPAKAVLEFTPRPRTLPFSFKAGTSVCATCRSSAYEWRPSQKRSAAPRWAPSALIPPSDCDGPPPHRAFDVRNLLKEARNAIPVWSQELRHSPGRCWRRRHARSLAACRRARRGMSFRLQLLVHPLLKLRRAGPWIRYGFPLTTASLREPQTRREADRLSYPIDDGRWWMRQHGRGHDADAEGPVGRRPRAGAVGQDAAIDPEKAGGHRVEGGQHAGRGLGPFLGRHERVR